MYESRRAEPLTAKLCRALIFCKSNHLHVCKLDVVKPPIRDGLINLLILPDPFLEVIKSLQWVNQSVRKLSRLKYVIGHSIPSILPVKITGRR